MRLNRLDLTRYGRFTDRQLEFPEPAPGAPDLHVIFGPNEAGKSTLFSAWLDLLYGIPMQSRYAFLHPGPTMQIGATLTGLQVVRVKKNAGSLQDANGQILPEATLQSALGGLTRDGYAAMFSLDDDTLEQGGEAILSSRGDLGEMLFSASAGLQTLAPQLEGVRRELDAFHKPRARSTALKATKDRLTDLDRQRRELDVSASAAQGLQRAAAAAEKAWIAARQVETDLGAQLETLRRALALGPLQARADRLRSDLAPLADLPDAGEAEAQMLQEINHAARELSGRMASRAESLTQTEARIDALPRDPALLPLAEAILRANGLYPLHVSALADLPKRRDALSEVTGDLTRRMQTLGLTGDAAAQTIPAAQLARLRALLARRDVLTQAETQAAQEAERAQARLADQTPPTPAEDLAALAHLMTDLRAADPEAMLHRSEDSLAARDGDLAQALRALDPWHGTAADLAAWQAPAPWTLTDWDRDAPLTRQALSDATHARARALADAQSGDVQALTDAIESRRQREAAWAAHRASLSPASATEFETALRRDDRSAERLAHAARAAEAEASLARAETALTDAQTAHARLETAIRAALPPGLQGASLTDLRAWLVLRDRALTAALARDRAETARAAALTALTAATETLGAALGLPPTQGLPRLRAEALARLDTVERQKDAARRLADLRADLGSRRAAHDTATKALADWSADWQAVAAGTPLAGRRADDPDLAALLDGLDHLARRLAEATDLTDRITKMEANSAEFQSAAAAIFAALGMAPDTPFQGLSERLTRAQEAERAHAEALIDLTRDRAAQEASRLAALALETRHQALGDRLGWIEGDLSDHLTACQTATRLRRDLAEVKAELAAHPVPVLDAETLTHEARAQETRLTLVRADSEAAFATLTTARQALAAVGGDDAVARIASERANLVNELSETARAHLALRLALMAFEAGLRRYRESHRSAMLSRASQAFSRLSAGAYRGLDSQPDGTSEVLVALPAQGGAKLAADLSKGTRFQLYLALRIAGYHELAKARPPVPFIADDIMETFDDGRSRQAFGLLAEMAQTGQVIYLTHHEHLARIAAEVCPQARITAL